ncbi:MAG: CRISPR-associated endonuclease Cas2 [Candidatus Hydrogenedentes bacterium]|nr:CRISPR-associated endonuclease Cas2 [Candidatus Hydrogenedentota bacterium]
MRKHVLITYDVSNDKRLRKIFTLLRGYGEHVQYSVFLCQLTDKDLVVLSEKIKDCIHSSEDQVILIKLGSVGGKRDAMPDHWTVFGRTLTIDDHSVMIF